MLFRSVLRQNAARRRDMNAARLLQAADLYLREYAYERKEEDGARRPDFTDTVYWHPALVLPNGEATIDFDLSDAERIYELFATGHAGDGRLGVATSDIDARKP